MGRSITPRPVSLANRPSNEVAAKRRGWVRRRSKDTPSHLGLVSQNVKTYIYAISRVTIVWPLLCIYRVAYALFLSRTSHRVILRILMLCGLHMTCMAMALLAFGGFYYAWVPQVELSKDVWLQYGNDAPWADVLLDSFPSDPPVWQKEARVPMFEKDQMYDVSLGLRIPVNQVNKEMGNFMVELSLVTSDGIVLYESLRPVLLVPDPWAVRWTSRFWRMLWKPIFSEPVAPTQLVQVPLLRRIVPYASHAPNAPVVFRQKGYLASHAIVRVGRASNVEKNTSKQLEDSTHTSVTLHPSVVQIEHATLCFNAFLSGASYVWPSLAMQFF